MDPPGALPLRWQLSSSGSGSPSFKRAQVFQRKILDEAQQLDSPRNCARNTLAETILAISSHNQQLAIQFVQNSEN
jgi:hypothetical protein